MKVAVFGGSGFLGSHVADALTEAGHEVTVFDRKKSPYLKKGQKMVTGDILDRKLAEKTLKFVDVVYNFAGLADLDACRSKPIETVEQNILGNTILLEASRINKVKRFVFASTIYVYSDSGSFYKCSKHACELYIETYQKQYGIDYTILRYGTVYGQRSSVNNSVHRFLTEAMTHGHITYAGNGAEVREYINVLDAAQASVEILTSEFKNKHVIFTGHHPMKVNELFTMIKEMLRKDVEIRYVKPKAQEPMYHYSITPYAFMPNVGKKYVKHYYTDMGQGLLMCMQEIHDNMEKAKEEKAAR